MTGFLPPPHARTRRRSMVYHVNSKVLYDKVALKESEDALRATLDDISVTVTNTVVMGTTVHLEYVYRGLKREDIDPADVDEMARRIGRPGTPRCRCCRVCLGAIAR